MRLGFDLIILGAPAAGKDTQAALLRKTYSLRSVESGRHWRALAKQQTPEGRKLRKLISRGLWTPVSMMKTYLKSEIDQTSRNKDLMFVGNPRLKPEAQLFKKLLDERHRDFFVLFLTLPEKEVYKRSRLRSANRQDDSNTQYIKNRIAWHKKLVGETVKYFQGLKKVKIINGNQTVAKVSQDINKAINDYQRSRAN